MFFFFDRFGMPGPRKKKIWEKKTFYVAFLFSGATGNVTLNYRSRKACEAPKQKENKYPIELDMHHGHVWPLSKEVQRTRSRMRRYDRYFTSIETSRTRMTVILRLTWKTCTSIEIPWYIYDDFDTSKITTPSDWGTPSEESVWVRFPLGCNVENHRSTIWTWKSIMLSVG